MLFSHFISIFFFLGRTLRVCTLMYILALLIMSCEGVVIVFTYVSKWLWLFLFVVLYFIRSFLLTPTTWFFARFLSFGGSYYFFYKIAKFVYLFIFHFEEISSSYVLSTNRFFSLSISEKAHTFFFVTALIYLFFIMSLWLFRIYKYFFSFKAMFNYFIGVFIFYIFLFFISLIILLVLLTIVLITVLLDYHFGNVLLDSYFDNF